MKHYRFCAIIILLFIFSLQVYAVSVDSLELQWGVLWIGNYADNKQPNPVTTLIGAAVPIRFTELFSLEPSLEGYQYYYELGEDGRVFPTQMETAENRLVWGLILSPRCFFSWSLSPVIRFGVFVSPSFLFRIPGKTVDSDTPSPGEFAAYFFGAGRFFYPETGIKLSWQALEKTALNLNIRAFLPFFHAWDGENISFFDQFMLAGGVSFSLFF